MADLGSIAVWLAKRRLPLSMVDELPELGWVVEERGEAICAGYLRRVEGDGYAIFDSIVSNPDQPGEVRNQALDLLYETALSEADRLGLPRLIGFTVDENTRKRSERHGFTSPDHTLLIRAGTKRQL
jgi:hypothetical protein